LSADEVLLERRGAVAELVLNRPGKQNAIHAGMWRAIRRCCEAVAADPAVRVLVVSGAPPAFSAGADIAEFGQVFADRAAAADYNELVQATLRQVERLGKPTLARIAGNCIGGGCALAVACDLRFAAADARLAITPARLGLAYALPDIKRLLDLVGVATAKDILFSGRLIEAPEALRLGLVDRVVTTEALAGTVAAYADQLCAVSGQSQRLIKQLIGLALDGQHEETAASRDLRDGAVDHADFAEGRRAFLERRRPRFD
jgi:enoyl-CoA hydratase/carnithine racemase